MLSFQPVTTVERINGLKRGTGDTSGVGHLKRMLDIEFSGALARAHAGVNLRANAAHTFTC